MTAHSLDAIRLKLAAITTLQKAGWSAEDIAMVLQISRSTIDRLNRPRLPLRPPVRVADPATGFCCQMVGDQYCDAPVLMQGAIFCPKHSARAWPWPQK